MPVPALSFTTAVSCAPLSGTSYPRERQGGPTRAGRSWNNRERTHAGQLTASGFLDALSEAALGDLDSIRQTMWYPEGSTLFMEGQTPRGLYILCAGQVKTVSSSRDGKSIILRVAEAGEVMGLSDLLSHGSHGSSAETLLRSQISFVPQAEFLGFLARHPEVFTRLAELLSEELRDAWEQIRLLALAQGTEARLAQWLLRRAERQGQPTPEGVVIRIYMTREEIGDSIGMSRETVSRLFSDFKRRRFICPMRGSALLVRTQALQEVGMN